MEKCQLIIQFWHDVAEQNAEALQNYFLPHAQIKWHASNELFSVHEYIIANCEYPGNWKGEVERTEILGDLAVSVTRVWDTQNTVRVYATSFFTFENDKILSLDEYWADCGDVPQWRLDKKIGKPIKDCSG